MTTFELGGTSRDAVVAQFNYFQQYENGILKLSPEGEALVSFLPAWMQQGTNIRNMQEAFGVEFERVVFFLTDLQDQFYVEFATWGLRYQEELLGLPIQTDLTPAGIARRRTLIITALAREAFTSEAYFQIGISLLAGVAVADVVITPENPRTARYTWRVEVPIQYIEDAPDITSPAMSGLEFPDTQLQSLGNTRNFVIREAVGGTFTLTFSGFGTTVPLPYNVAASTLETEVEALGLTVTSIVPWESGGFEINFSGSPGTLTLNGANLDGGGEVPPGTYTYKIAYRLPSGSTLPSVQSDPVVVSRASDSKVVLFDVPTGPPGTLARDVYRKLAADTVWTLVGSISNNLDFRFNDLAAAGTTPAPTVSTARTEKAALIEQFIRDTKPAHLRIVSGGTGFRADISKAGESL